MSVEPPQWNIDFTQFGEWGYGNYLLSASCKDFPDYAALVSGVTSLGVSKFHFLPPSVPFETQNPFEVYNQILEFRSEKDASKYIDLLGADLPDTTCSYNEDSILTQTIEAAFGIKASGFVAEDLTSESEEKAGSTFTKIFMRRGSVVSIIVLNIPDDSDYVGGLSVGAGRAIALKTIKRFTK